MGIDSPGAEAEAALVGIVLAAGQSRRFGQDKRWVDYRGEPLLAHSLATARSVCSRVLLVVERLEPRLERWANQDQVELVVCPAAVDGLSASRGCALAHLGAAEPPDGLLFFLGDMPEIRTVDAERVVQAMLAHDCPARPMHAGQPGHPVAFPGRLVATLCGGGGRDLRACFKAEGGRWIDCAGPGVIRDVDRPADMRRTLHQDGGL